LIEGSKMEEELIQIEVEKGIYKGGVMLKERKLSLVALSRDEHMVGLEGHG
jgi:hypothetical protein